MIKLRNMEKKKYVISACLLGVKCRFDGRCKLSEKAMEIFKNNQAIAVCPEQLAGFTTPRLPIEISGNLVLDENGKDVTEQINQGIEEAMKLVKAFNPDIAILKDKSPTCGVEKVFDGSHSGKLISGKGLFTKRLIDAGVEIEKGDE